MKAANFVIRVADYRKSFEFYHEIMGLKLSSSWQRKDSWGAIFSAGSMTMEIIWFPAGEGLEDCNYRIERTKISMDFDVSDLDILYKRLSDLGVTQSSEPHDVPWGFRIFSVMDPDGVMISFRQPSG